MVAVDNERGVGEQALALQCRQHLADRVVRDGARAPNLVREPVRVRGQRQAVLDVGDQIPNVDREGRRVGQCVEAREQRREVVGPPHRRQVVGPGRQRDRVPRLEAVETDQVRLVTMARQHREQVAVVPPRAHALEFGFGVEFEVIAVQQVRDDHQRRRRRREEVVEHQRVAQQPAKVGNSHWNSANRCREMLSRCRMTRFFMRSGDDGYQCMGLGHLRGNLPAVMYGTSYWSVNPSRLKSYQLDCMPVRLAQ